MPITDISLTQAELFGSLFVLIQHLTRMTDSALRPLGITTRQWLLLAVLTKWFPDRSPTLSEAATRYGSSRQNVKQIALQLEARGWVRLERDPLDRRATRLALTDAVRVFDEPAMRARQAELLDAAFEGLGPAEVSRLRNLVVRWLAHVDPEEPSVNHARRS